MNTIIINSLLATPFFSTAVLSRDYYFWFILQKPPLRFASPRFIQTFTPSQKTLLAFSKDNTTAGKNKHNVWQ